jgi:hypothetical protein
MTISRKLEWGFKKFQHRGFVQRVSFERFDASVVLLMPFIPKTATDIAPVKIANTTIQLHTFVFFITAYYFFGKPFFLKERFFITIFTLIPLPPKSAGVDTTKKSHSDCLI